MRRQQQVAHIGLHKAHFTAVALQMTIHAADFDLQLRLAFVLERRQQRHHLRILGDLRRIQHPLALAVIVSHFFLQVDRDQLIVHQLHLAVAELKIGAADVFAPLMRLDDPDAVLTIRRARGAWHIIDLLFIFRRHAYRILRVTADDHRQRSRR